MKKNAKRFAGMLLVLAMLLSLSVTAFAADYATVPVSNITVTLKVENVKGGGFEEVIVDVPENTTIYTLLTQYNALPGEQNWTVNGDFYGDSWFMNSMSYNNKTYATEPCPTQPANIIDPETKKPIPDGIRWANGYGLISVSEAGYKYCYAGYAWMYTVVGDTGNQDVGVLAMNEFVLRDGNAVTLSYDLQTSVWTQAEPLNPNPFA